MASTLQTIELSDGNKIVVEVEQTSTSGVKPVGVSNGKIDITAAVQNVKSLAAELMSALATVDPKPKGWEVTFGIKLSASAGVILAKAGSEANFGIKMSWSR
jgi:hypothetical protein